MSEAPVVPTEVLAGWDGRWRYPELAVALNVGDDVPERLARALLADLAAPCPPLETARRLIKTGQFALLEKLESARLLTPAEVAEVGVEREAARSEWEDRLRRRWARLAERARRIGQQPPTEPDLPALAEQGGLPRYRQAEEELELAEAVIADAEAARRAELLDRLDARVAEVGGDVEEWRQAVRDCVMAHRFPTAERLIVMGPGQPVSEEPLAIPRPPGIWTFPEENVPAEELLGWCLRETPPSVAGFGRYIPAAGDTAALDLLRTVRKVTGEVTHLAAIELVAALHRLIGVPDDEHVARVRDGGVLTRVRPGGAGLPPLLPCAPEGLVTWVAPADRRPPADAGAALWLVLGPGTPTRVPPGDEEPDCARLDLLTLLRLLAVRAPGPEELPHRRRITLLRMICARLPVRRVLPDAPGRAYTGEELAWLLDLLGAQADAICQDLLRYETGGHRLLVRELLARLIPDTVGPRDMVLDVTEVDGRRRDGDVRAALRRLLDGAAKADLASAALLRTAALFYWDDLDARFTWSDLLADMARLVASAYDAEEQARDALDRHRDVLAEALEELVAAGLFVIRTSDRYALPFNGLRDLLREADPARTWELAVMSVHRMNDHVAHDEKLVRSGFVDQVISIISHDIENDVQRIGDRLTAARRVADEGGDPWAHLDDVTDYIDAFPNIGRYYADCLDGPYDLDVGRLLREAENGFTAKSGAALAIDVVVVDGPLTVHVTAQLFKLMMFGFFRNTQRLMPKGWRGRLQVTARGDGDWCVVSIEDDGPGFKAKRRTGVSAKGIPLARVLVEDVYGGSLTIAADGSGPGGLPGAHIRFSLPLVAPTLPTAGAPGE